MNVQHPGFAAVSKSISAKEGIPEGRARAILAASTRKAKKRPGALKKNPRLAKVKG